MPSREPISETLVIQFAKVPVLGGVKTRLQPVLTEQHSLELHQALCCHQLEVLQGSGFDFCLALSGDLRSDWVSQIRKQFSGLMVMPQHGADLGHRMAHAVTTMLKSYRRCIVIGSDCPFMDAEYLRAAENCLSTHDCVIGPAYDGGYVLVGFRRFYERIFSNVDWGTESVLQQTLDNLDRADFSTSCLDRRQDIDGPEDLLSLQSLDLPLAKYADIASLH